MAEPFTSQVTPVGIGGVNLKKPIDQVSPAQLTRMTNVVRDEEGALTGRPGLTSVATAGTGGSEIHSLIRVNHAEGFERYAGVGTELWCGTTGPFAKIDEGYSGDPLTLVNYHPPISGDPWVYVWDRSRNRQVRASDCLVTTINTAPPPATDTRIWIDEFRIPVPASLGAVSRMQYASVGFTITSGTGGGVEGDYTTYDTLQKTTIDNCDIAGWTNNAGTGGAPTNVADPVDKKEGAASVKFTVERGAVSSGYYNFWAKANSLDLSSINGVAATDDDLIHLWLRIERPDKVLECRLYFVVNSSFSTSTLPGTDATDNTDAYICAFRPSDFTGIYESTAGTITAAGTANTSLSTLNQLPTSGDRRGSTELVRQQTERSRKASKEAAPGRGAWTEFGIIGVPLHRRDFARIGNDSERTWSTVTGVVFHVFTVDNSEGYSIWLDDIYLTGGAGLDTSLVGMIPYSYRHTNFDPRSGDESNPSPEQAPGFQLDSTRRAILIHPTAVGDAAMRQKFYRKGGTLTNDWYFLGTNTSDGGTFRDDLSDTAIQAAPTLETDNDQPITTVDAAGNTVLAQTIPAVFGPVSDILFGCGDPLRKGHIYWSKPEIASSWPARHNREVCSPSEELMHGFVIAGQAFVFSRERLFSVTPELDNADNVTVLPTGCNHGLASRWGFTVGIGGCYFVSKDGIYRTSGGSEESITDDLLRPLFSNEAKNGYQPIDFAQDEAIRLKFHGTELWFEFQDTGGTRRLAVYHLLYQFWRFVDFTPQVSALCSEEGVVPPSLLIGGRSSGKIYTHTGTSDDGSAIVSSFRTAALDQGLPRENKLYGDIVLDADRRGGTVTIQPLFTNETIAGTPQAVSSGTGRQRYYVDTLASANSGENAEGLNLSIDVSWSTSSAPPIIYRLGPSFAPQPDTSTGRVTNWDVQGRLADKLWKGALLEVDTGGVAKSLNVELDGAVATTISVTAAGRQVVELTFPQVRGRIIRLVPADVTPWQLYQLRWIFDQEPLKLSRWETQEITHGINGWHYPTYAHVAIQSTADVTLQVLAYNQSGVATTKSYTIPSTSGAKKKLFLTFEPTKGILYKYLLTSSVAFWLYREETEVWVAPWGGTPSPIRVFGNDDLDPGRGMGDAGLASARSGGALD